MKTIFKRTGAIIITLCIVLSVVIIPSTAANYVANWGQRGVKCTSLTSYTTNYYTGNYAISVLASKAGGTGRSDAPSSALYSALKSMMTSKHEFVNSYNDNKSLIKYTDCQNSDTSKISSFYSGTVLSSSWNGTWNREHTWPNSKGLGGSDEDDIMMIRPTSYAENGSRGNTAYGKSSGYYNPNSESGGALDLRGDVARICLYVYTRWGNTSRMWGSSGVIESLDVLIEWMISDPVDTWEMGKNDAVQSITGVRNVYVDYPELAFKLFGYQVPSGYSSPSGLGNSIGGSGAVVTPPTSTPTTPGNGTVSNVLDAVTGNTNTNNNTNTNTNTNTDQITSIKVDTSKDYEVDIDECRHEVTVHKNEIPATCEKAGMTAELLCDQCGLYISAGKEIPKLTHKPSADGVTCEYCGIDFTKVEINIDADNGIDSVTLWLIIGGAAVILIAAGVVITVIVIKKKKTKISEQEANLNK